MVLKDEPQQAAAHPQEGDLALWQVVAASRHRRATEDEGSTGGGGHRNGSVLWKRVWPSCEALLAPRGIVLLG
jgi:hypothetical protein